MMRLYHMLDQFMVQWYQMAFGSRIQGYPNPSDPSTYLSTLIPNLFAQGSGRRIKECVCVYLLLAVLGSLLAKLNFGELRWES